jgi:hypothetical protein
MTGTSSTHRRCYGAAFAFAALMALVANSRAAAAAGNETDPLAGIVRIDVQPPGVVLESVRGTVQLIVTGYDSAGNTRDLTRVAVFRSRLGRAG